MATVPTADRRMLGMNVAPSPDRTPLSSASSQLAVAGAASQSKKLSESSADLMRTSEALAAADAQVQSRQDTIDRARIRSKFTKELRTKYNAYKTTGDASDIKNLQAFNTDLDALVMSYMSEHEGSNDSRVSLYTDLSSLKESASVTASEFQDTQALAILSDTIDDELDPLVDRLRREPGSLAEVAVEAEFVLDKYKAALTPKQEMDRLDAINQKLVLTSINRFTSVGDYESAKKLIDDHPNFISDLNASQQQEVITKINTGIRERRQIREAISTKIAAVEAVAGPLSQAQKTSIALGQPLTRNPLSTEGKKLADRIALVEEYGENHPHVQRFDKASAAVTPAPASKLGKLIADRDALIAGGAKEDDARVVALDREIEGEDPKFKDNLKKVNLLPKVEGSLNSLQQQTTVLHDSIRNALSLVLGRKDNPITEEELSPQGIADLKANILGLEKGFFETGAWGSLLSKGPFDSDAAALDGFLTTIKGINIVNTIAEMRKNSPTGGAMGALSDREGAYLAAANGPLDIRSPDSMVNTLLTMYDTSRAQLEGSIAAYNEDFGDILEKLDKKPFGAKQNTTQTGGQTVDGKPRFAVNLKGENTAPENKQPSSAPPEISIEELQSKPVIDLSLNDIARLLDGATIDNERFEALSARAAELMDP